MKLVYYSLSPAATEALTRRRHLQLRRSIASLREHNRRIRVVVFAFGDLPPSLHRGLERQGAEVRPAGSYEKRLLMECPFGRPLAWYPTLQRWLVLRELAREPVDRVLYLDCDTYFFRDVDGLFREYSRRDWYAREEPFSTRSPYGYDPAYLDESALYAVARSERVRAVPPFNIGVVLMKRRTVEGIASRLDRFLSRVWRFMRWMHEHPTTSFHFIDGFRALIARTARANPTHRPLRYPAAQDWIMDEVAIWLTLGSLRGVTWGFLSRADVPQNGEYLDAANAPDPIVCHYYSGNTGRFHTWNARRRRGVMSADAGASAAQGVSARP